jgi:predicted  nucleic acid-binding Zn-ribbon protein|tara:strand:- start:377 stop:574 length:198 start_codon:yes stop_codon:yes gene_type:complete
MQTMDQDTKNKIRELEHRKIDLNEQLSMTNSTARFKEIEEELYEINDTIKKLTANMEPEMEWYGS